MRKDPIKVGMKPPHPGEFIREEVLEPLELSITKAAEILDVRRATLSDLINEKAALSPEMALRIEKAFDLDMDTMLRMQAWYDSAAMRAQADSVNVERYEPV
ncbi:MAG: HigA family addiction module antitoxin [Rhodospirillales bacterium]|nr:HigA family addiction module antitoxin [Rhodospirillales bacterium]